MKWFNQRLYRKFVGVSCFTVGYIKPLPNAKFRGNFDGGNSSFDTDSGDFYIQGQFTSPTSAKGVFNGVLTEGDKTCKYKSVF